MLRKFIQKECISLELQSKNKADVIDELIGILDKAGKLNDREIFKKEILKREAQSSTGLKKESPFLMQKRRL